MDVATWFSRTLGDCHGAVKSREPACVCGAGGGGDHEGAAGAPVQRARPGLRPPPGPQLPRLVRSADARRPDSLRQPVIRPGNHARVVPIDDAGRQGRARQLRLAARLRYGDLGILGVNHLPQPGIGPPPLQRPHITGRRRRIGHKPCVRPGPRALAHGPELARDACAVVKYLNGAG